MWELEVSEKRYVIEASEARGVDPPEFLRDVPLLLEHDQFYLDAFWQMSTCRQSGWSIGPIPWDAVVRFAEFVGLDTEMFPVFLSVTRALDSAFLEWMKKRKSSA